MSDLKDRITSEDIDKGAALYDRTELTELERKIEKNSKEIRKRGYLRGSEFRDLCRWKNSGFRTARNEKLWNSNDEKTIRSTTKEALRAPSDDDSIKLLTKLDGVGVRTATAILNYTKKNRPPILDVNTATALDLPEVARPSGNDSRDLRVYPEYEARFEKLRARLQVPPRKMDKGLFIIGKTKRRKGRGRNKGPCTD